MRVFITHILPKDQILEYKLSVAACNFSYNLIEGGVFDRVYSTLPTYVSGQLNNVGMDGLVYSSWRTNPLLRRLAPIWECLTLYKKIPKESNVWLYNVSILNAFLIILIKLFKRSVGVYVILLDYTPTTNVIERFFLWLANHADGDICLANSPLFTNKNSACLPGVTPLSLPTAPMQQHLNREFLLSGVLNERIAMLSMVLHVFSQLPQLTLHVTGEIHQKELLEQYSKCPNIIFHGQLPYEDYLQIFHHVSFQLSTRNPKCSENQCNFPSKIMEALLHNRIVISTIHYEQLDGIRYFEVDADETNFMNDILRISDMKEQELMPYANQGQIVSERFNAGVWKDKMYNIENHKL